MSSQSFIQADAQSLAGGALKDSARPPDCARIEHGRSKTDLKFWQRRIFKPVWRASDGRRVESANYAAQISFRGRRIKWTLDTPNRDAAAARAKEIFLFLQANGWEAALSRFRPKEAPRPEASELTVDQFLTRARACSALSARTFTGYAEALRRIVAAIAGVPNSSRKYDKVHGGRLEWLAQIGKVRLAEITPQAVEGWKRAFLSAAKPDPISQRSARVSVNSYLRRAKCLFAKEILCRVDVSLPEPLPFAGVRFERRPDLKYHSDFDIRSLVALARAELGEDPARVELFKVFVLAAMCGLRRHEIDLLPWSAFRFEAGLLRIEATEFFQPKSDESSAELPLEPELVALFRGYHARAKSQFVVESVSLPRPDASYLHYRCESLFRELAHWLRTHGVKTARPLHTLRKEFGSAVNRTHGIHAASRALRHSSIGITAEIYVDSRVRFTSGLGSLLSTNVLPICPEAQKAS